MPVKGDDRVNGAPCDSLPLTESGTQYTGTEVAVRSIANLIPYLRALSRRLARLLGMSSSFPKRRLQ